MSAQVISDAIEVLNHMIQASHRCSMIMDDVLVSDMDSDILDSSITLIGSMHSDMTALIRNHRCLRDSSTQLYAHAQSVVANIGESLEKLRVTKECVVRERTKNLR